MQKWVKINKPWSVNIDLKQPKYPVKAVKKAVMEMFCTTQEKVKDDFEKKHKASMWDAESLIRENISVQVYKEHEEHPELLGDLDGEIDARLKASKDPILVEIRKLRKLNKKIDKFTETIPEVIAWKEKFDLIRKKEILKVQKACFSRSELNRPGVLIEVQYKDGKTGKHLIGHINTNCGVCDDCTAFNNDTIVLRAKVLVQEEEFNEQ